MLKQEDYPELSRWAQCNERWTREKERIRKGDVIMEAEVRAMQCEDATTITDFEDGQLDHLARNASSL